MGALVFLLVFVAIIALVVMGARKASRPFRDHDRLSVDGLPARGIVLSSSPYFVGGSYQGRAFEKFRVRLDVEVEGSAPYELDQDVFVPRGLVSLIPGNALELRVDPSSPNRLAIIGPGGFTGPWLRMPADFLAEVP